MFDPKLAQEEIEDSISEQGMLGADYLDWLAEVQAEIGYEPNPYDGTYSEE